MNSDLTGSIDSFDASLRKKSLLSYMTNNALPENVSSNVNMHLHSFFSFNSEGYSPTHVALMARQNGWYSAGLCDFDVLTGCEEFLYAGEILGLRTSVNLETRAFMSAYSNKEIDSPGEPGVSYCMGAGFYALPKPGSKQDEYRAMLANTSSTRNKALIARINAKIPEIAVSYESDVIPKTPSGSATERHIIAAYIDASLARFKQSDALVGFWTTQLSQSSEAIVEFLKNRGKMEEVVRSKLAKRGGLGYEQPTAKTFPLVEKFFAWVKSCGAIPAESWLDGTSSGEVDGMALLTHSKSLGALALNIIPDRNWNISDASVKATKVMNLRTILACAQKLDMPINSGTEMNKTGQVDVDNLNGPVLCEFKEQIIKGANIMVGHTTLGRFCNFSYSGQSAIDAFPSVTNRNDFFASVGSLPPVTKSIHSFLCEKGSARALDVVFDSAKKQMWQI